MHGIETSYNQQLFGNTGQAVMVRSLSAVRQDKEIAASSRKQVMPGFTVVQKQKIHCMDELR